MFITRALFILLFLIGLTGSIVFFPMPIDRRYTCIAEHNAYVQEIMQDDDVSQPASRQVLEEHGLLQRYLNTFAFLWWSSLLVIGIGAWKLRRLYMK